MKLRAVMFLFVALSIAKAQDSMPAMKPDGQQQSNPAPAPCVETMPGMQMCPPAAAPGPVQAMPGMQMGGDMKKMMDQMEPQTLVQQTLHHASSGTTGEPNSTPTPMLMTMKGPWMLMFHGNAFITDTQQSALQPGRGGDKFYSTNWLMPMAERRLGPGQLTIRTMFSLEPATISERQYPLLFQQGETAFGKPIADGQHPHDFFMELAALYDVQISEKTLLSFYAAPIGDPSIGPTAYPHRASASEDPVGSLGHHQEDSTHIASDVVTMGVTHGFARIEASGFHGREPDEFRWNIDQGKVDSWSTRMTLQPGQNWSGQYSYARIASPEQLFPAEDQERMTSSVMYNRPLLHGNWASTALWGRTRSLTDNSKENSYLLESLLRFKTSNYAWTRLENAGRSNELINGANPLPAGFQEAPIGHVAAYTFGYDRDVDLLPRLRTAVGAQVTTYGVPETLSGIYGSHPYGVSVFVRLRPFTGGER